MIDIDQWKRAVQMQTAGLEVVLKNISGKPYSLDLKYTASLSAEDAEQQMKDAEIVVRYGEKNFQSEILLGFNDTWISFLAEKEGQQKEQNEEFEKELIEKVSKNITDIITSALEESGIEVDLAKIDTIERGKLSGNFDHKKYFLARLEADPIPEDNGSQVLAPPEFWVALSHPDEEQVAIYEEKFETDNPFMDDRYPESIVQFARRMSIGNKNGEEGHNKRELHKKEQKVEFEDFSKSQLKKEGNEVRNIDILENVELHVSVELGQRQMALGDILKLVKGSIIELDKLAGEPVEILVNGHKIAQGDVVVVDEYFGVRVGKLLASQEHIKELQ